MTLSKPEKKTHPSIYFIIIALPFLLFYWMIPFVSDLTIGNDYPIYSIQWQMELLFSIKTGSFPLYAPGFAFGHSSSALTLGQIFHPLTYISSHLPGYWSGKALQWNTFLRLLTLGLAHLALFTFLKKIRVSVIFSFLLSCITVYNLRMLDLFRFGASLETYTGFLFLCTAIGWYFLKPSKLLGPLSITGATYWLICSGHPSMMYYGVLGTGLFLIVIPHFLADVTNRKFKLKDALTFWSKTGLCIFLGVLLSSAYILPYYFDFIQWNSLRVAQDYNFSLSLDTSYGKISNFFMPLFTEIHGAYGSSYLLLIAAILPVLRCFKIRIPRSVWITWGVALLVYLYMEGAQTPIHRWVWEYVPFASSVRGEGRMSIVMPILIMLLLSWIVQANPFIFRLKSWTVTLNPYVFLAFISLFLIVLYALLSALIKPELSIFSCKFIRNIPLKTIALVALVGITSLVVLILYGVLPRARNVLGIILCVVILLHIGWILRYGIFIQERHNQPTFDQMKLEKKESLNFLRHPGSGLFSSVVKSQMDRSFLEPSLGSIYFDVTPVSSQDEAYDKMNQNRLPHQIFIEKYDPEKARLMTDTALHMRGGKVDLVYSSYNRLQFRVIAEMPAFFALSYPYTGNWNVWVNGKQVRAYRANGASHAVEIPKGESLVEFQYWSSAAFWGIVVSCGTFVLIGLYFSFISLRGLPRIITSVFLLIIGVSFVIIWNYSLYTGENLKTNYSWTYTPPKSNANIAYGKMTSMAPLPKGLHYIWFIQGGYYQNHISRIVDGNKSKGSGFMVPQKNNLDVFIDTDKTVYHLNKNNGSVDKMHPKDDPSVTIDLSKIERVNSLMIYASPADSSEIISNFEVLFSVDQATWERAAYITPDLTHHHPIRIELDSPQTARYIQIKVTGSRKVILDEVEVYGMQG